MNTRKRDWVRGLLLSAVVSATFLVGDGLLSQEGLPKKENAPKADEQKADEAKATQDAIKAIRTDFRHDPPVATQVVVKWLEKDDKAGNALIQVEYDGWSRRRLGRTVDIQWEGRSVTLRNDGKEGDEKADDNLYSAMLPLDFKALEAGLRLDAAEAAKANAEVPIFVGRVKVGVRKLEPRRIDFDQFKRGGVIKLLPGSIFRCPTTPPVPPIDPERSLLIRHLSVVEDMTRTGDPCSGAGAPMGKWSFGHLMTQMANQTATGINPSDFVRFWLSNWETAQSVNSFDVPSRTQIQTKIIGPWQTASGGPNAPLNLAKSPFRLLAIVNRIDLRDNFTYGGGVKSAGEARFVFCAVDLTPGANCGKALPFTVIFEYGIKKSNCAELKAWAQQWANLSSLALGTPAYNNALEAITNQFVKSGADSSKPNGSALNQLRTNEIALSAPWELREFTVSASLGGHLDIVTVKQTPDDSKNAQTELANYVNANLPTIKTDKHVVPATFPGIQRFLGSRSLTNRTSPPNAVTPPPLSVARDFWDGPAGAITDRDARFHFSLGTCNGCHGGETFPSTLVLGPFIGADTFFTHIKPREAGTASTLSGFLTGNSGVTDPADATPARSFHDLADRKDKLEKLLKHCCSSFSISELFFKPLRMTH